MLKTKENRRTIHVYTWARRLGLLRRGELAYLFRHDRALKILYVDDNTDIVEFMTQLMRHHRPKWEIEKAHNGVEGLEKARTFRPHVICANYLMPVMDGAQMCRRIRDDNILPGVRIIFNSACDYERTRNAAKMAGADEFLLIPFAPREIIRLIERCCGA